RAELTALGGRVVELEPDPRALPLARHPPAPGEPLDEEEPEPAGGLGGHRARARHEAGAVVRDLDAEDLGLRSRRDLDLARARAVAEGVHDDLAQDEREVLGARP